MTQALYAHVNNKKKIKTKKNGIQICVDTKTYGHFFIATISIQARKID
jgi:hypothetical protein